MFVEVCPGCTLLLTLTAAGSFNKTSNSQINGHIHNSGSLTHKFQHLHLYLCRQIE